ncbi:MAG: DUF427 domain-containing protein [Ignavibacteria bacterium]
MKPDKITPKAGEESVWDYPRPPEIEEFHKRIKVIFNGIIIADTRKAMRVLETSHPPVYYIPPEDIKMELLASADNHSFCEWKGTANYYHLNVGDKQVRYACWYYPEPVNNFKQLKNYVAFYAQKMDECYIDDELVAPQPGKFYGGWITKNIVGPFKGEEGSENW